MATSTLYGQAKPDGGQAEGQVLKVKFPEVKGWQLSEPRQMPSGSGGYSVGYNSEDEIAITVYVYNRGLARIPDDLSAEEVQREFASAKDAVLQAQRLGYYEQARVEESGQSALGGSNGGPKALYARLRIRAGGREGLSEIYVLTYRNHFIKVRATRPAEGPKTVQASLDRLFAALSEMLSK